MTNQLDRAIARFRPPDRDDDPAGRISAAAFRAAVHQRLLNLEREAGDLKGRLNGLIFLVIGTVITQVVLKVVQ
jgi:hypothetical protein